MRILLIVWAVSVLFITVERAAAADGAVIYGAKCAACHGSKGEGSPVGPPQKGSAFIKNSSAAEIKKVIMEGRSGDKKKFPDMMADMPKGLVSEAEAEALVVFLKGPMQK